MKKKTIGLILLTFAISTFAQNDTTGRNFVAELPDAIVCIYNNPQQTRYIYYKTAGAKNDLLRYDGPNNNLLHYYLPSGILVTSLNPQPAAVDCVSQNLSLQYLIDNERAYKMLVPMPSSNLLNGQ